MSRSLDSSPEKISIWQIAQETSFVLREMQIKTMNYHFIPTRMAKTKKQIKTDYNKW